MNDRSTLDQDNILYKDLTNSAIKNAISGDIYKYERPDNSDLEDVVINSITITNDDAQLGVANVNIHVPAIDVAILDKKTRKYNPQRKPNLVRLQALASIAFSILKEKWGADYNYWVANQTIVNVPASNERFINFTINFKLHKY